MIPGEGIAVKDNGFTPSSGPLPTRVSPGEWYSTDAPGERFNEDAYDRSTLVRYFAARHARGERLVLRWFRFNGNTNGSGDPYGNFQYTLVRSADDLEPTRYHGKGQRAATTTGTSSSSGRWGARRASRTVGARGSREQA